MNGKFLYAAICLAYYSLAFSQYQGKVGINTSKPEQALHVNGTMKATDLILDQSPYASKIPELTASENYSFLLKSTQQHRITTYNVQSTSSNNFPAPFGVIRFDITTDSGDKDWVKEYDTKISATKYIAILNSFNFNLPVVHASSNTTALRKLAPVAQVFTYIKNGTWWIKADYHGFAPPTSSSVDGLWNINLMVFDKTFARTFTPVVNLNGATTGQAAAPIIIN